MINGSSSTGRISSGLVLLAATGGFLAALFWKVDTIVELSWLGLGSQFGLDPTGKAFLLFTSILWLLSSVFGLGYLWSDQRRWVYDAYFLSAMLGNFGLILARDAVTFYFCFALMSFASFGLVIHNRDKAAIRAGKVYMTLVIIGEVSLFAALVSMVAQNGLNVPLPVNPGVVTSQITIALLIVGFGIKVGLVTLHVWLPLAHPAAPPPASAVLSGAMIKAGLLGWIRFLPLGQSGFEGWGTLLIGAGLVSAFFGVIVGLMQTNPKTILAYSSISQMGFMTLGIGAGLLVPQLWPLLLVAVTIYAFHHSLAKGALFLGAGIVPGGMPRLAWLGIALPALSLGGAPFLSGAVAKTALKSTVLELPDYWPSILAILLPIASIGTTVLMARFIVVLRTYHLAPQREKKRTLMFIGWTLLLICSLSFVWIWDPASGFASSSLASAKIVKGAWPVAVGIALAWVIGRAKWRGLSSWIGSIPAGDLLVPVEQQLREFQKLNQRLSHISFPNRMMSFRIQDISQKIATLEKELSKWSTATILLIVILAFLFGLAI